MTEESKIKALLYMAIGLLTMVMGQLYKNSGKLDMLGAYVGAASPGGSLYGHSVMLMGSVMGSFGLVIFLYGIYRVIRS